MTDSNIFSLKCKNGVIDRLYCRELNGPAGTQSILTPKPELKGGGLEYKDAERISFFVPSASSSRPGLLSPLEQAFLQRNGNPGGPATLGIDGTVPKDQLPKYPLSFKGTWNAESNVPDLQSGVGTPGDIYVVSTAGTTELDGNAVWAVGDSAVFSQIGVWIKLSRESTVGTDLSVGVVTTDSIFLQSSAGSGVALVAASSTEAGLMSGSDAQKLAGIETGAEVNEPSDLTVLQGATVVLQVDDGASGTIQPATQLVSGVLSSADKIKIDGIEAGAEVNPDSNMTITRDSANASIQVKDDLGQPLGSAAFLGSATSSLAGLMTPAQLSTLNLGTNLTVVDQTATSLGIRSSTQSGPNAVLTEASATLGGLLGALDKDKLDTIELKATNVFNYLGQPSGVASLTASGKLPVSQLPLATLQFQGTYDALSGTAPTSSPVVGQYWILSTAGPASGLNPTIIAGTALAVGDWLLFGLTGWAFVPNNTNPTDLGVSRQSTSVTILSSTGADATISAADSLLAGTMTASDFNKLSGVQEGAQANVGTNLGSSEAASTLTLTSSTGSSTVIQAATETTAGVMTSAQVSKLMESTPVNVSFFPLGSEVQAQTNTSSERTTLPAATLLAAGAMSAADKSKLDGVNTTIDEKILTEFPTEITFATTDDNLNLRYRQTSQAYTTIAVPQATATLPGAVSAEGFRSIRKVKYDPSFGRPFIFGGTLPSSSRYRELGYFYMMEVNGSQRFYFTHRDLNYQGAVITYQTDFPGGTYAVLYENNAYGFAINDLTAIYQITSVQGSADQDASGNPLVLMSAVLPLKTGSPPVFGKTYLVKMAPYW